MFKMSKRMRENIDKWASAGNGDRSVLARLVIDLKKELEEIKKTKN